MPTFALVINWMLFVNANNLISILVTLLVGATILMYVINAFGKPGYYLGHCVPGIRYTFHSAVGEKCLPIYLFIRLSLTNRESFD